MGGFGTWYTAMAKPEMFAAIAPHCGGGMAWNAGVLDMPVWVVHGSEDVTVSPNQSDEMVDRLKKLGRDVTYRRLDGVGHAVQDYSYDLELLQWMLAKSRRK
jgi:predicted peptidase